MFIAIPLLEAILQPSFIWRRFQRRMYSTTQLPLYFGLYGAIYLLLNHTRSTEYSTYLWTSMLLMHKIYCDIDLLLYKVKYPGNSSVRSPYTCWLLNGQVLTRDSKGITNQQLEEFRRSFLHFDKSRSRRLDSKDFKSCLISLGYNIKDDRQVMIKTSIINLQY